MYYLGRNIELIIDWCRKVVLHTLIKFVPFFELASAGLRKSMQVDKIVDFQQLFEIISSVGMKTDGLKTMEEMKEKLRKHIEESSKRQQDAKVSTD